MRIFLTPEDRKSNGAHYTPRLLAEMTLDVACENTPDWDQLRYFDPCCGSGIFMVTLFNRLATQWEIKHPPGDRTHRRAVPSQGQGAAGHPRETNSRHGHQARRLHACRF